MERDILSNLEGTYEEDTLEEEKDRSFEEEILGPCCVCGYECSKLHGCVSCDHFVHVFHSEACPIVGTEGFGKKVKCPCCAYPNPFPPAPSSSTPPTVNASSRKRRISEVEGATQEGRIFSLWINLLHFPYMGTSTPVHSETFNVQAASLREVKDKIFLKVVPFLKGKKGFFPKFFSPFIISRRKITHQRREI